MKKWYLKILLHIGIAFFAVFIIFIVFDFFLGTYTKHGESLTVPDFKGKTIAQVEKLCEDNNIRYFIKDSVFDPNLPRFTVVEQNPVPLSKVKENRRIYITINGKKAPMVKLPDITQNQHRIAIQRLESVGLFWDEDEERRPDVALNAVLEVRYRNRIIQPGEEIPKGSQIHLVLGDGLGGEKIEIPDLVGKSFEECIVILRGNNLNIGKIIDEDGRQMVTAPANYEVISQKPRASNDEKNTISEGEAIDIEVRKP